MKKIHYQAYGLSIVSDFEIDAFQKANAPQEDVNLLCIEKKEVDFEGFSFEDDFVIREYTEIGFLYVIKDVVAFLISENLIKVNPLNEDPRQWQSFLVGGAMSIALNKIGYFLLHGSAIESDNSAYLFLGFSGVGKSSVAAALEQRKYRIITDDVCPLSKIDNILYIIPGTQQARLLQDTVEELGIKQATVIDHPNMRPKFGYQFAPHKSNKTKIRRIIELAIDENLDTEIKVERIESFEKIKLLKENIYKAGLTKIVKGDQHGFQSIMMLVNNVDCFRIKRKRSNFALNDLVDLIEAEIIHT